jgi:hypothetical protein
MAAVFDASATPAITPPSPEHGEHHRQQTLQHLHLVAAYPGYWELRALQRTESLSMKPRGSFWFQVLASPDGLIFDRLDQAIAWADHHNHQGTEVFLGANPRSTPDGRTQRDVAGVTCAFVDLDLHGIDRDAALAVLLGTDAPPSLVVNSGNGLHAYYLLDQASSDLALWKRVQISLVQRFSQLGADPVPAPDRARVLRLAGYPNRKTPEPLPTEIVYEGDHRYGLQALAAAFLFGAGQDADPAPAFPQYPDGQDPAEESVPDADVSAYGLFANEPLTPELLRTMVDTTVGVRRVLTDFVITHMRSGVHYGVIPGPDGRPASKPTLLKPGAELLASLFGLTASFYADEPVLKMYGAGGGGTFAFVCVLKDRHGKALGEGRGVAETRELTITGPNMATKMGCKRAFVDAILRVTATSSLFTQDLEEPPPPPIEPPPAASTAPAAADHPPERVSPAQVRTIRLWLGQARRSEEMILHKLRVTALEDLTMMRANKLIDRLQELATQPVASVATPV